MEDGGVKARWEEREGERRGDEGKEGRTSLATGERQASHHSSISGTGTCERSVSCFIPSARRGSGREERTSMIPRTEGIGLGEEGC